MLAWKAALRRVLWTACRDYCEELRDSLDLVPIGAWHGNGRKVGWYSPFLLAAYDPDTEEFQSVCRCMSGYTDAFYAEVTPHQRSITCTHARHTLHASRTPNWDPFKPDLLSADAVYAQMAVLGICLCAILKSAHD